MKKFGFGLVTVILGAVALMALSCGGDKQEEAGESESHPADSVTIVLAGEEGRTVVDILALHHRTRILSGPRGVFVREVDDVANGGGYFWLYSVNGEMATVSADQYTTSTGDVIRWHFRKSGT